MIRVSRRRAIALRAALLGARGRSPGAVALDGAVLGPPGGGETVLSLPEGWTIAPGMVDLQVNGFAGAEVDHRPSSVEHIAARLPTEGVTAFCPTLVSLTPDEYERAATALDRAQPPGAGARILAPHLEGPFLARERAGAHRPDALREPSQEEVERLLALLAPSIVTLAPELPGAIEAIRHIRRRGAIPAVGHTDADAATARRAIGAGAALLTHAPNAMRGIETRRPTALVAFLVHRRVRVSMIADGEHVDTEVIGLMAGALGSRLVAVSDATAPAGAPPGDFQLAGRPVHSDGSRATLADGTLAGSASGLGPAPATLRRAGLSPARAIMATTAAPRRLLGLPWRLAPGDAADLTIFDAALRPQATIVGGDLAYAGPELPDDVRDALS